MLTVNLLLPRVPRIKIQEKSQISFCNILKSKWYHAKVLQKGFHLNGHAIGFRQQTQKLELTTLHVCIIALGVKVKGSLLVEKKFARLEFVK